jgi:HD-GYP domain-containing protein (c-di-GMP phosphodiesterase class II)
MNDPRKPPIDMVSLSPQLVKLGMQLEFSLYDENGHMLLAREQTVDSPRILAKLHALPALYADRVEAREPIKSVMESLDRARYRNAPLKDLDALRRRPKAPTATDAPKSIPQAWSDLESRLRAIQGGLARDPESAALALERLEELSRTLARLMDRHPKGSLFLLFNRSIPDFTGYSTLHSLLCAALGQALSPNLGLDSAEQQVLCCAALTMNLSVKSLQDTMAMQKSPPSREQLADIDRHPIVSANLLRSAGVDNRLWLDTVAMHHDPLPHSPRLGTAGQPERLAGVLQVIDRYTAALSPRGSRPGRDGKEATRSVIKDARGNTNNEAGLALLLTLGLYPPGSFVRLSSGDVAVVLQPGRRPNEAHVSTVVNKRGEPVGMPRILDTAIPEYAISEGVSGSDVRVRLNEDLLLRQISALRRGSDFAPSSFV